MHIRLQAAEAEVQDMQAAEAEDTSMIIQVPIMQAAEAEAARPYLTMAS